MVTAKHAAIATTDDFFAFTQAHQAAVARGMGTDEALGYALGAEYASRPAIVERTSLLAGMPVSRSLVKLDVNGLHCAGQIPSELYGTPSEAEARAVLAKWQAHTTASAFAQAIAEAFTPEEQAVFGETSLGWAGGWGGHGILGYDIVLAEGISGLRRRIDAALQRTDAQAETTRDWYRALQHVCDGMTVFIQHHADRARALAAEADDAEAAAHFAVIADTCAHVATQGARTLREAVQLFWFIHVLDNTDSPGRLDQFLWPYYQRLPGDAEEQRAAAMPILDALWRRFIHCRTWNVCLGGQTAAGEDATNALTYCFLDLQARYDREAPNLSVRFFHGSPPELLTRCVEVIARGAGNPALYNDEIVVPSLCSLGIPLEDARDYAFNGCAQIDIGGKSHMGLEDGEVNLAKCLEYALHGGKSGLTGQQVVLATPPPEQLTDYDALFNAYRQQVEYCTRLLIRKANLFQRVIADTGPHLFRSLFFADCLERGKDFKRGGPRYNHGQFLTEGIANTADALYAIRQLVFTEKVLTLPELVAVLDADWQGHAHLRTMILERLPKFGNDVPAVDEIAADIVEHYFAFLRTQRTWRGGRYAGGISTFTRAPIYGQELAASADGRRCGEIVADSVGPMRGSDRHGPTAMLSSVAKLPLHLAGSGVVLNMKLSPSVFTAGTREEATQRMAVLVATYFRLGGQQVQVNVHDEATLRAALETPSAYPNLIVRVGGFCARFIDLEPALQQDIIARTQHAV